MFLAESCTHTTSVQLVSTHSSISALLNSRILVFLSLGPQIFWTKSPQTTKPNMRNAYFPSDMSLTPQVREHLHLSLLIFACISRSDYIPVTKWTYSHLRCTTLTGFWTEPRISSVGKISDLCFNFSLLICHFLLGILSHEQLNQTRVS